MHENKKEFVKMTRQHKTWWAASTNTYLEWDNLACRRNTFVCPCRTLEGHLMHTHSHAYTCTQASHQYLNNISAPCENHPTKSNGNCDNKITKD